MPVLPTVLIILGLVSTVFGYLIYFRKKFNLVNGFRSGFYLKGRQPERFALRIGLIEFIAGIVLLLVGLGLLIVQ